MVVPDAPRPSARVVSFTLKRMSSSSLSRRHFLQMAGAVSVGFGTLRYLPSLALAAEKARAGYGPLVPDPRGLLDLPRGFSYRVVSRQGDVMSDGLSVPGRADGMGAFPGPNGRVILVRNHETAPDLVKADSPSAFGANGERLARVNKSRIYDRNDGKIPHAGGTSTLVYNPRTGKLESSFLSLAGTNRNCAGGPTPWNSWISCEETHLVAGTQAGPETARYLNTRAHGYNFEVPATTKMGLVEPVPLVEMGRFRHEAVAVDARSGHVFQTEDRDDGLIYRFRPKVAGKLARGGRLEALKIVGRPKLDTRNWEEQTVKPGQIFQLEWVPCEDADSNKDDLRLRMAEQGAAIFARGEGMWFGSHGGKDAIYFAATTGGKARKGQIWKIDPRANTLTLWCEPNNGHLIENADNLTVAPWGDVILSEDLATYSTRVDEANWLVGVTPRGQIYKLARNALNREELAGVCFSPDGSTLFVNIYHPATTLAITGPWRRG